MTTYETIKKAIENRQSITCTYNGFLRKMTPHVIGIKSGKQHALFFQYGGHSKSGLSKNLTDNWRCIEVGKITNLTINQDTFQTANNHSITQSCIDIIDFQVDY
jgi:hypothetical protein